MSDPRANLPSASNFARYASCPGSFLLEQRADPEPPDPDAERGTRIHAALADQLVSLKDNEEQEMVERCRRLKNDLIRAMADGDPTTEILEIVETRLWMHDPATLKPLFSGQADVIALSPGCIMVVDYKTGHDPVPRAEINWQLRALASLVSQHHEAPKIIGCIIQPFAEQAVSVAMYGRQDIETAVVETIAIAKRVTCEGEPRVPSPEACKHCRAKAICPELGFYLNHVSALTVRAPGAVLDPDSISIYLDRWKLCQMLGPQLEAIAKKMIAQGIAIRNWTLKPGARRQTITNVGGVWTRAAALGVNADRFTAACSMNKTDLKDLLREELHLRGKALDNKVKELTLDYVEEKQNAPSLERIE